MKIGVLGTGFGAFHAALYKQNPLVDTVKIWGRDRNKREMVAGRLSIEAADTMEEIIDDPSIDLIDICLPNDLHRSTILAVLERGKPAFCETPVCTETKDLEAIQAALDKYGGRVFVNQFIKFFPEYRYIHDVTASGEHGKLLSLHAWRNTPAIWGELGFHSISTSLMMHELDFTAWISGLSEDVHALGVAKDSRECGVGLHYVNNGVFVQISAMSMMPPGFPFTAGYTAVFEHAAVEFVVRFPGDEPVKQMILYKGDEKSELHLPQANPYAAAIGHVLDSCRTGKLSELEFGATIGPVKAAVKIRKDLLD